MDCLLLPLTCSHLLLTHGMQNISICFYISDKPQSHSKTLWLYSCYVLFSLKNKNKTKHVQDRWAIILMLLSFLLLNELILCHIKVKKMLLYVRQNEVMRAKTYDVNETLPPHSGLWRRRGTEKVSLKDHQKGKWRHERMWMFPLDWAQFLCQICEIVSAGWVQATKKDDEKRKRWMQHICRRQGNRKESGRKLGLENREILSLKLLFIGNPSLLPLSSGNHTPNNTVVPTSSSSGFLPSTPHGAATW